MLVTEQKESDIPQVDEQEMERRVEDMKRPHLETIANKVFETAKGRYINLKQKLENKQDNVNTLV